MFLYRSSEEQEEGNGERNSECSLNVVGVLFL